MDKMQAVYVAALLEEFLSAEPDSKMGKARKEFQLAIGAFGLEQLQAAAVSVRKEWQIPDKNGDIEDLI